MKYFKKLEGERIYLSPMNIEDVEIYCKWLNDFSVTDGLGGSSNIITLLGEKNYIENVLNNGKYQFAIVKKENDILIGNCGFHSINHIHQTAEVGIFIGEEENRNKGYGTETLRLLLNYGFNYLNLNNIMLRVISFNEGAISCYKKLGFKEIGKRTQAIYLNCNWYNEIYMEVLKKDYIE